MVNCEFQYIADTSVFTTVFIIKHSKNSDYGYTLVVGVGNLRYVQPLHKHLPFWPLVCTFDDKNTMHITLDYYHKLTTKSTKSHNT